MKIVRLLLSQFADRLVPEGYQDARGFHLGTGLPPRLRAHAPLAVRAVVSISATISRSLPSASRAVLRGPRAAASACSRQTANLPPQP